MFIRFSPFFLAALALFSLAAPAHAQAGDASQSCGLGNSEYLSVSDVLDHAADTSKYYEQKRGPTRFHAVQCYCLEADCQGKWPIALIDTVWDPKLPYFCEGFFDYARNRWSDLDGDGPMNYSGWTVDFPRNNALDNPLRMALFSEPN